ncbi:hypothetical protein AGDE_02696 [Angomonas deanei]|uniref:protein-tyrosine-phosphatase n=1 Tax=Angomonas deanei TaxID=59799 RepID=A0A7G2CES9_9TRYP|nr:hypothetical protein AGDE_02696 [Angomonas deanei]CAD2217183.1 Tyrosine phosphatase family, putative [Angomonas deanei]|eukprot:EPY41229.1 hypothetical protein AGDE_02696 [Angomonas deanei]
MKITPPNFGYVEERIFRCGSPEPRHYSFLSSLNLKTCVLLTDTPDEAFVRWLQENNIMICCPIQPPQSGAQGRTGDSYTRPEEAPNTTVVNSGFPSTLPNDLTVTAEEGLQTEGTSQAAPVSYTPSVNQSFFPRAEDSSNTNMVSSNVGRFLRENTTDDARHFIYTSPVTSLVPQRLNSEFGPIIYTTGMTNRHRGLMTLSEPIVVSTLHLLLDPKFYPLLITCSMGRYRTGIVCGCLRKIQGWCLVSILEEYRRFAGDKSRAENEEFIELFDRDLVSLELEGGRRPSILYH